MVGATQVALELKNPPGNVGDERDIDSVPGSGKSPGQGKECTPLFLPVKSHRWWTW